MEDCSGQPVRYSANASPRLRGPAPSCPSPTLEALSQAVRQFEAEFEIADEDAAVTALLLNLVKSRNVQGKQIHDANIVASMRRHGIPSLLTHNIADFTRYVPELHLSLGPSEPSTPVLPQVHCRCMYRPYGRSRRLRGDSTAVRRSSGDSKTVPTQDASWSGSSPSVGPGDCALPQLRVDFLLKERR